MRHRISPLKFLDLLAIGFLTSTFIFIPVAQTALPKVKGDSTISQRLTIPTLKTNLAPDVTAQAVYIYDPDSQTVVYQKNSDQTFYPASTTKLMTALVSLSFYNTDSILTVKNGGEALGSVIHLTDGDKLSFETLLYGLLISSGNDAALTMAENYPGGYSAFVKAMNEKATALGLTHTHFSNPSGIINPDHYTSARDLTIIAAEAIKKPIIIKIVGTQSIVLSDLSGQTNFHFESTNKLLGLNGVRGLKTGWAPESGECLVTLVERDGHPLLVTLLDSKDRFGESKTLIDWAYQNLTWRVY